MSDGDDSAYHSSFNDADYPSIAGMMLLPYKDYFDILNKELDIIEEALNFYTGVMSLRRYAVKGRADSTLVYLFLFITECCKQCINVKDFITAHAKLRQIIDRKIIPIPGDVGFPLNDYYDRPKDDFEKYLLRSYLMLLEQECLVRLLRIIYQIPDRPLQQYLEFGKQIFLGYEFEYNP